MAGQVTPPARRSRSTPPATSEAPKDPAMTSPTVPRSRLTPGFTLLTRRTVAFGIDLAMVVVAVLVARRLLGTGFGSLAMVALVLTAVFGVVEGETGFTAGKALLDLRLVNERGQPPGTTVAIIRSAAWVVDGLPCLGALALALIWFSPKHQRIGDLLTGSRVISTRDEPAEPAPTAGPGPAPEHYSLTVEQETQHFDPIWDDALAAYVQWDPVERRWMKYDDALGGWGPVHVV